jgi:glyoxylase-like metal-dependent hydrolase (beta-lactamase superfamily II)
VNALTIPCSPPLKHLRPSGLRRKIGKTVGGFLSALLLTAAAVHAQTEAPKWCSTLPHPEYTSLKRVPVADGWFEVYKVAPDVLAIYEPHQSQETIGYLIEGKTRALLLDTGMGIGDLKALTDKLTRLPIVVLNSHTHHDHVGNNWQFATIYGMDTDFTRKNAQGSREAAQQEIKPSEICGSLPEGFDRDAYRTKPWKITKYVHDGETIDLGGRQIEMIATPGHTPDAICLFDKANRLLFTGDTYYPGTIWLFSPETDLEAYGRSVKRMAALAPQVKLVLGAHNVPVASPTVLGELSAAFEEVMSHKIAATPAGAGKVEYKVGNISFLMRAGKP